MLEPYVRTVADVLAPGQTLYRWAARARDARALRGRGAAYAVSLRDTRVVVRHSRHGGLLAPATRDLFLAPTRAPHELAVSRRLRQQGVPTPEIVAYATYRVAPGIRRADVVTREIADATDLAAMATIDDAALDATAVLLRSLTRVGAIHRDLNLANVLVAGGMAYVLDVDRIEWAPPGDRRVSRRNVERFARSARKLAALSDQQIRRLAEAARVP